MSHELGENMEGGGDDELLKHFMKEVAEESPTPSDMFTSNFQAAESRRRLESLLDPGKRQKVTKKKIMPTSSAKLSLGASAAEIVRLTAKVFTSPFDVLRLERWATERDIASRYKELAALIHPDKNPDNKKATEAFHVLQTGRDDAASGVGIMEDETYDELADEARRRVKEQVDRINLLKKHNMTSCSVELEKVRPEDIAAMCERMRMEIEEQKDYAQKTVAGNIQHEKAREQEVVNAAKDERRREEDFRRGRNQRGADWREYNRDERRAGVGQGLRREHRRDRHVDR